MKNFMVFLSNGSVEQFWGVSSAEEAIEAAVTEANRGFWLPPSEIARRKDEPGFVTNENGYVLPTKKIFATKIDELKSSYGGGGYDMIVVSSHELM
ncbi:hypothetical protein GAJ78_003677 [Escherichia coli]|nr:hypothetical protein [Escherichia coli]